ncbi:hypothetical protein CAPTEDRAFT_220111 [Capitella teleta]|uniref:Major facilitator superfamily (MFS) profile domain-containing protein n=1 Tax=Capitella teleta TaxID=283909 RepID=R7UTA2_CAPTE|nr:hypothetical protein CAPTEDRAFT_220111 [Capitella teleta]|eukprot:ELU06601.1 hypothetical protein CAPTEDRAFT_220111 [Capitella teleta]
MPGRRQLCYSIYVLLLLVIAYLLNQLDRYTLGIVTKPMSRDLEYGDQACFRNSSLPSTVFKSAVCNATTENTCDATTDFNGTKICAWDYNGQGFEYELLAGPIFIVVFTFVGIPISFVADIYNRKNMLAIAVTFWSLMAGLTGFVTEYWQLALLRFGLGAGEAGCTPFATSLISDYFDVGVRASTLGVYNWGIYMGYSLSYAVGNFITKADIMGLGWRWVWFMSAIPGLLLGPLIFFSVKEPVRGNQVKSQEPEVEESEDEETEPLISPEPQLSWRDKASMLGKVFLQPSILLLCLGGSIRNAAGYVWAYNTQIYYEEMGEEPEDIGRWMSWVPLVGGSISVVLGGFISDRIVKRVGPYARLLVLIGSQLAAAPFVAGALYLKPPAAYAILIPGYIIGEMWVSVCLAVAVELVPSTLTTSAVAIYLFIITNIGGNMPLLVPPLKNAFMSAGFSPVDALRAALYILYPGLYVLGGFFFFVTLLVLRRDLQRARANVNV